MKRKTIITGSKILMAALFVTAVTACSQEDETSKVSDSSRMISFAPTLGTAGTRLTNADIAAATDQLPTDVGVLGYPFTGSWTGLSETPSFFIPSHQGLHCNDIANNRWNLVDASSNTIYAYWPGAGNLRFYAYAPYGSTTTTFLNYLSTTGEPKLSYTVPSIVDQEDLLFAVSPDYDCTTSNSATIVSLPFKHILTALKFSTGTSSGGTITDIRIDNIYNTGVYTPSQVTNQGWTIPSGASKTSYNNSSSAAVFMMIPQNLPDDAKVVITYADGITGQSYTLEYPLKNTVWEGGKIYNYGINLNTKELTPTVVNWTDEARTLDF